MISWKNLVINISLMIVISNIFLIISTPVQSSYLGRPFLILHETYYEIDIPNNVTIEGSIYWDQWNLHPEVNQINVTLNIENCEFNSTITPSNFVMRRNATFPDRFIAEVQIPKYIKAGTEIIIIINASLISYPDGKTVEYYGHSTGTISAVIIKIMPYYDFELLCINDKNEIKIGQEAFYQFTITNRANGNDTFSFDVHNKNDLKGEGLSFVIPNKVELCPNETKTIMLIVNTSGETKLGDYNILFTTKSNGAERSGQIIQENITITLCVNNYWPTIIGVVVVVGILTIIIILIILKRKKC